MTRNGHAYRRRLWVPAISGIGGGALRTPTCGMVNQDRSQDPQYMSKLQAKGQTVTLAAQMLPSPSACVANDGERPETWLARRERVKAKGINGNGMGMPLTIAAQILTPCASDWKGRTNWEAAGRNGPLRLPDCLPTGAATYLNPSFVEEMMGYPVGWTDLRP